MATLESYRQKTERALQDLQDMKNHEAEYAVINRYQNIINQLDGIRTVCNAMAEDIGKEKGLTRDQVLEKYCERL